MVTLLSPVFDHTSQGMGIFIEIGLAALFILLCITAIFLFNQPFGHPTEFQTNEQYIKSLVEKNLLVSTDFQAVRAFQVEEYEDEGSHYFIELATGAVLYLVGQYLYDYERIEDDPELNQPRCFPCTDFTLRTHRTEKFVVDIQCRGTVIEPEYVTANAKGSWKWEPEDGQIITDQPYDTIKNRITGTTDSI